MKIEQAYDEVIKAVHTYARAARAEEGPRDTGRLEADLENIEDALQKVRDLADAPDESRHRSGDARILEWIAGNEARRVFIERHLDASVDEEGRTRDEAVALAGAREGLDPDDLEQAWREREQLAERYLDDDERRRWIEAYAGSRVEAPSLVRNLTLSGPGLARIERARIGTIPGNGHRERIRRIEAIAHDIVEAPMTPVTRQARIEEIMIEAGYGGPALVSERMTWPEGVRLAVCLQDTGMELGLEKVMSPEGYFGWEAVVDACIEAEPGKETAVGSAKGSTPDQATRRLVCDVSGKRLMQRTGDTTRRVNVPDLAKAPWPA